MSRWMFALVGAVSAALLRPAQVTALAPQSCVIRGSFVLPGGAPEAGAHGGGTLQDPHRERTDAFERRQDGYGRWNDLTV